jgi:hypothetical protein
MILTNAKSTEVTLWYHPDRGIYYQVCIEGKMHNLGTEMYLQKDVCAAVRELTGKFCKDIIEISCKYDEWMNI